MASISESEMTIVHKARAESRSEVTELEQLRQQIRASYLLRKENSENDFVRRWPEICSETLRQRALPQRAR
jgi:hypothetical protein